MTSDSSQIHDSRWKRHFAVAVKVTKQWILRSGGCLGLSGQAPCNCMIPPTEWAREQVLCRNSKTNHGPANTDCAWSGPNRDSRCAAPAFSSWTCVTLSDCAFSVWLVPVVRAATASSYVLRSLADRSLLVKAVLSRGRSGLWCSHHRFCPSRVLPTDRVTHWGK